MLAIILHHFTQPIPSLHITTYRLSELVRLYSVTGCRTIEWDKPKARDLHAQRHKSGVLTEGGTSAVINSNYDKSAFDCCIASKFTFVLCCVVCCFEVCVLCVAVVILEVALLLPLFY